MDASNLISTITTHTGNKFTITSNDQYYKSSNISTIASLDINEIIKRIDKEFWEFKAPKMKSISCLHCGAPLEMKVDDHIVNCAYCHSVYAIDMEMIRDLR